MVNSKWDGPWDVLKSKSLEKVDSSETLVGVIILKLLMIWYLMVFLASSLATISLETLCFSLGEVLSSLHVWLFI